MDGILNGPRDPHGFGIEVPPTTVIPTPAGTFVVGHVERIHGEGGRPCPEYIPTRHEVEVLARHWAAVECDHALFYEVYGQTGGTETRELLYARDRLAASEAHLGTEAVAKIRQDAAEQALSSLEPDARERVLASRRARVSATNEALRAGETWARDPANCADLERLGTVLSAADIRGPEELYGGLLTGTFPEANWLFDLAARSEPASVTGEFDECEHYAANFASGAMTVLRATYPPGPSSDTPIPF